MAEKIVVVDDEEALREVLLLRLRQWGYRVRAAENGVEAQKLLESFEPDLVISDVVMPEISGLELLKMLKEGNPSRPVVLITAHANVEMAVEAMKLGAADFLTKPLDYDKLQSVLRRESLGGTPDRRPAAEETSGSEDGFYGLVGKSREMRDVFAALQRWARTDSSVFIHGESGTGKELAARAIHELSRRSEGPFIAVNSAAIPSQLIESEIFGHEKGAFTGAIQSRPGCFELANRGTLFLDEIAEMPLSLQPKLLRVLEDGKVRRIGASREVRCDVRLVAATNKVPLRAVENGELREDLYYRLNVFSIEMPPLRKRTSDLPVLAERFMQIFNQRHEARVTGLGEGALQLLEGHAWPGNVREFRNVMERAVVLAGTGRIEPEHLPLNLREPGAAREDEIVLPLGITAAEAEKQLILRTLEDVGGNKAEAGRRLGLDVKTIRNKLKAYQAE